MNTYAVDTPVSLPSFACGCREGQTCLAFQVLFGLIVLVGIVEASLKTHRNKACCQLGVSYIAWDIGLPHWPLQQST